MEKENLKKELMDFAKFCKKLGGTSWCNIPEDGIDWYLREKFKLLKISDNTENIFYRILEEVFEDGHSKFYAQYFGKVMTPIRRSSGDAVSFDIGFDWLVIDNKSVDTIDEAKAKIKQFKQQLSPKVNEIIHAVE